MSKSQAHKELRDQTERHLAAARQAAEAAEAAERARKAAEAARRSH